MTEQTTEVAKPAPAPEMVRVPRPQIPQRPAPRGRYSQWDMGDRWAYAKTLAMAGNLIPTGLYEQGTPSPGKVFLVLETGEMLGIEPMAALQGISVIEGRATISPQLMSGLIRRAGHRLIIRKTGTIEGGDYAATVTLIRSDAPEDPIVDTWTPHRAARAGLCTYTKGADNLWKVVAQSKGGGAKPWQSYPESMCVWRAMGVVGREGADDVLMGVAYTPEELDADVDEDGGILELPAAYEDRMIEHIRSLDDKADLAVLYHDLHDTPGDTERIRAAFDAHLMTVTKDSRPPKEGKPGQTGDPALDAKTATHPVGEEQGPGEAISASATENLSAEEIEAQNVADAQAPADEYVDWMADTGELDPPADR